MAKRRPSPVVTTKITPPALPHSLEQRRAPTGLEHALTEALGLKAPKKPTKKPSP